MCIKFLLEVTSSSQGGHAVLELGKSFPNFSPIFHFYTPFAKKNDQIREWAREEILFYRNFSKMRAVLDIKNFLKKYSWSTEDKTERTLKNFIWTCKLRERTILFRFCDQDLIKNL